MLFRLKNVLMSLAVVALMSVRSFASEANLVMPDLSQVSFLGGISGSALLTIGLLVCIFGLAFGFIQFNSIKKLPVQNLSYHSR